MVQPWIAPAMMVQPLLLVVYSPGEGSRRFDGTGHGLQLQCAYNRHRAAGYLLSSLFYSMVNNNVELPKVLCLGMSYTNLPLTIQEKRCVAMTSKPDEAQLPPLDMSGTNTRPSVKAVIDNVKLGNLTAIDGRDLARCRATEVHCCVDVYTVSQEKAAVYEPSRHLEANFNRPAFVSALQKKFGGANPAKFQFDQVILDYFWIPPGWDQNHWSRGFFSTTLSDFAQHNLLKRAAASSQIQSGVIYLPFCFHCFRQVMANWDDSLRKYYDLSFLRTGDKDLYQITLWAGTQQIDSFDMQSVLEKQRDQEELYCTFGPKNVKGATEDEQIAKASLVSVAQRLEDFSKIRFMALTRLPRGNARGHIHGLLPPSEIQRGYGSTEEDMQTTTVSTGSTVLLPAHTQPQKARFVTPPPFSSRAKAKNKKTSRKCKGKRQLFKKQATSKH